VPAVVAMVHEPAEHDRAADQCRLTTVRLEAALSDPQPPPFGHVASGATVVEDWLPDRLTGAALRRLARRACPAGAANR